VARLIDEKSPDEAMRETIKREMTEALSAYGGRPGPACAVILPSDNAALDPLH
jgi:hypothetical protein